MGDQRSRRRPSFAHCPACAPGAKAGPADGPSGVRHAHWSIPIRWRSPMSVAVIVALVAALGIPWLDRARSPVLPSTEVLTSQLLADPEAVHRVQVGYLSTSWQDTDGTHRTLTGLTELTASTAAPGSVGHAARAGLARIDDALRSLMDQDPQTARQVAARVAPDVHPDVLATHLPAMRAILNTQ